MRSSEPGHRVQAAIPHETVFIALVTLGLVHSAVLFGAYRPDAI
jgi:hypothetical protein